MTKRETIEKQINECMDWFDFEKVHKIMTLLDWQWCQADGNMRVPYEGELRASARKRLQEAVRCKGISASGGFRAEYREGAEVGKPWVKVALFFELDSWEPDGEYYNEASPVAKAVKQLALDGEWMATFPSAREAERQLGISYQSISHAIRGVSRTAGGYKWELA